MTFASALRTPLDAEPRDFSIILGGPLFQLLRRTHITGDALELLRRRVVVISLFAWLPLLVISALAGDAFGGSVAVPFVKDVEVHVRFLVAMPLLVIAELVVHRRLRPVAYEFLARGLVPPESVGAFEQQYVSAMRIRNSVVAEAAMIVAIYVFGVPVVWRLLGGGLHATTWFATTSQGEARWTLAGMWYAYVSIPIFQFLLLRWYFRLFVWMRFLFGVSRIRLNLHAIHADRMAGLGFLGATTFAFVPLAAAHGALLAGTIANRIFYDGQALVDSRFEIATVVAFLLVLVLGPLIVFAPQVSRAKRVAVRTYGRLSQRYASDFEAAWLPGGVPPTASPLGSSDIQSLADLANSLETLRSARIVPITRDAVLGLAIATLLPIAPLLVTVVPAEEIAKRLLALIL